jgi:hypothetical protein
MTDVTERPQVVDEDHLTYLDELRESGVTNMFGAAVYLEDEFGVDRRTARTILQYWMESFNERHPRS